MWRIAVAEWRNYWGFNFIGPALAVVLVAIIYRDFSLYSCCSGTERDLHVTKLLFMVLVYCQTSMAVWAQNGLYGPKTRQRLMEPLPLSQRGLNLSRIFTGLLFMPAGLISWIPVFALWLHFDQPIPVWVPVFATLFVAAFIFVCMRRLALRYVLPVLFPFIWFPDSEKIVWPLLEGALSPWGSLLLAVVLLLLGWHFIGQPPPRWARG
jgi:hypothetical protein